MHRLDVPEDLVAVTSWRLAVEPARKVCLEQAAAADFEPSIRDEATASARSSRRAIASESASMPAVLIEAGDRDFGVGDVGRRRAVERQRP